MTWTQPVCRACWYHRNRHLDPVRVGAEFVEKETCCRCGKETTDGIYVREDPTTVPYPRTKEDS